MIEIFVPMGRFRIFRLKDDLNYTGGSFNEPSVSVQDLPGVLARHILMALLSSSLATNSRFTVPDFLSDIGKVSKGYI